jgi:hypothetical protein
MRVIASQMFSVTSPLQEVQAAMSVATCRSWFPLPLWERVRERGSCKLNA